MRIRILAILASCLVLSLNVVFAEGIVESADKAPVAPDGTTAGRITDFVITLDRSLDPSIPGRTLLQGNSIRITLPSGFRNTEGYAFGSAGAICGPPLSGDECNTGVLLQGWPQHPIVPPAAKYSMTYDEPSNTIVFTALVDLVPAPPLEPGIKQLHLILLGFTNPGPGQYRVQVEAETGPGGTLETGYSTLQIVPLSRPSVNMTSTGDDNMPTLNTIYQSTTVNNTVPLKYNFLLWDRNDEPFAGVDVVPVNGNDDYLLRKNGSTVGHVRIDAPDGATGQQLMSFGPSVVQGTPVFGPPSMTARWVGRFMAGSEPGMYTITVKINGGNSIQTFVTVAD